MKFFVVSTAEHSIAMDFQENVSPVNSSKAAIFLKYTDRKDCLDQKKVFLEWFSSVDNDNKDWLLSLF